jgi:hypothetical protein
MLDLITLACQKKYNFAWEIRKIVIFVARKIKVKFA